MYFKTHFEYSVKKNVHQNKGKVIAILFIRIICLVTKYTFHSPNYTTYELQET